MKYNHPTIDIQQPAPGHFVIRGLNPASLFIPDVGHVALSSEFHVSPGVPSDALRAILEERGDAPAVEESQDVEGLVKTQGKRNVEFLAGKMYSAYCEAVGGKASNGDDLPTWSEFRDDVECEAWVAAAHAAVDACAPKTEGAE